MGKGKKGVEDTYHHEATKETTSSKTGYSYSWSHEWETDLRVAR